MGDVNSPTNRRPGIAFVRPKLHDNTQENRDLFRRWAKLHMPDTLAISQDEKLGGASRVLRYRREFEDGGEEYLFTIVLDDVRLPGTNRFRRVPQRLDLENTRTLGEAEEAVLKRDDPRIGTEPMVFTIVSPSVSIFEAVTDENDTKHSHRSYQHEITEVMTKADPKTCTLITVTMTITKEIPIPYLCIKRFRDSLIYTLTSAKQQIVHTTLYRHAPDAQPDVLPRIPQGEDGKGEWLVCALVGGDRDSGVIDPAGKLIGVQNGDWVGEVMLESVEEWRKGLEKEGASREVALKVAVWKGDIFM